MSYWHPPFYCSEEVPKGLLGIRIKKTYKTKQEAWQMARKNNSRAYKCQHCGFYHLTSKR